MDYWQDLLDLRDWTLTVEIQSRKEMPSDLGSCDYDVREREADIAIRARQEDPELTLIHELIHLWTRQVREARKEDIVEEQAINAISKALLELHRRAFP